MRTQQHLQERHLVESVRRKVITEDQMQAILGVARSMEPGEGAAPDFKWVGIVQGFAAAVVVVGAALALLGQDERADGRVLETLGFAIATLVAGVGGTWLRDRPSARIPAATLLAGAAGLAGGVGRSLWLLVADHTTSEPLPFATADVVHANADIVGAACILVASIVIGRRTGAPVLAAPGAIAFSALTLSIVGRSALPSGIEPVTADLSLLGLALGLGALGFTVDRFWRHARTDAGFWIHGVSLLCFGLCASLRIDRTPLEVVAWLAACIGLALIGLRADRRIHLLAAATGVVVFPAIAIEKLCRHDEWMVFAAMAVSTLVVAVVAAWLRAYYTTVWLADPTRMRMRTVWC